MKIMHCYFWKPTLFFAVQLGQQRRELLVFILVTLFTVNSSFTKSKILAFRIFSTRENFYSKCKQFDRHVCWTICPSPLQCINGAGLVTKCETNAVVRFRGKSRFRHERRKMFFWTENEACFMSDPSISFLLSDRRRRLP